MNDYPYYGVQRPCRVVTGQFVNRAVYNVQQLSNTGLYYSLSNKNVISALMDISGAQFYTGGIFTGPCSTSVNHNLLIVGAGTDTFSGVDYWLLMNTWGTQWGEGGFMRIARFKVDGNPTYSSCGLNMYATYPTF